MEVEKNASLEWKLPGLVAQCMVLMDFIALIDVIDLVDRVFG